MITCLITNAKYRAYKATSLQEATTFALEFGGYVDRLKGYYLVFLIDGLRFTDSEKAKFYNFLNFHLN